MYLENQSINFFTAPIGESSYDINFNFEIFKKVCSWTKTCLIPSIKQCIDQHRIADGVHHLHTFKVPLNCKGPDMKVLIVFETKEGQTAKIVRHIKTILNNAEHEVRLVNVSNKRVQVSFRDVHKVILAAPVHERRHPKAFEVFLSTGQKTLNAHDTLLLSVSLKAAFAGCVQEAEDYVIEMEMRTGFTAKRKLLVPGAVRRGSYDYFSSQILRYVVLAGQEPLIGDKDHEFTDWPSLEAEVFDFVNH